MRDSVFDNQENEDHDDWQGRQAPHGNPAQAPNPGDLRKSPFVAIPGGPFDAVTGIINPLALASANVLSRLDPLQYQNAMVNQLNAWAQQNSGLLLLNSDKPQPTPSDLPREIKPGEIIGWRC